MTRLRDLWRLLGELLSGRLLRRLHNVELAVQWQLEHHARWEQEIVRVKGTAVSKTQALSRDIGALKLSVHALAVKTADKLTVEQAITLDDDEETSCVIVVDADSKT